MIEDKWWKYGGAHTHSRCKKTMEMDVHND